MGTGEADDVVSGRSRDRQWAGFMAASGQFRGRLRAEFHGRRHDGPTSIALTKRPQGNVPTYGRGRITQRSGCQVTLSAAGSRPMPSASLPSLPTSRLKARRTSPSATRATTTTYGWPVSLRTTCSEDSESTCRRQGRMDVMSGSMGHDERVETELDRLAEAYEVVEAQFLTAVRESRAHEDLATAARAVAVAAERFNAEAYRKLHAKEDDAWDSLDRITERTEVLHELWSDLANAYEQ